jgi:ribosome-associated protein
MLYVTENINIREQEIEEHFIRSSGPGGQNINKVSTAVQLRFAAMTSEALPSRVRQRLKKLAGRRMTADGVLVIEARRYRTQERNRQDARQRLVELIRQATLKRKPRLPTRPSLASQKRRLETKTRRGKNKRLRAKISPNDE